MLWTYDKSESTYSAVFPQSKVRIVVEGDDFSTDEKGQEILASDYLPLKEGKYYHFELNDHTQRLSKKSSFVMKPASHGSIAPGTAVGYGRLYLEGAESPELSLGVEVASEVISYKKDYQELLQQLTEDVADLQMQCSSCVAGLVKVDPHAVAKNDVQRFFFLLGLVGGDDFEGAVRQIVERPQTQLVEVEYETDIRRVARIGRNELRQIVSSTRRIELSLNLRGRYPALRTVPERIACTRRIESVDTHENKFVKYVLNFFLDRLRAFREVLRERYPQGETLGVEIDLDIAVKRLTRWTSHEFFKQVGPLTSMPTASMVLQRREGYREVLKKWLQLQAGTQLAWKVGEDVYAANQRKMSTLYEYWCFFRLLKIVCALFGVKTAQIAEKMIGRGSDGLSLKLKEGQTITLDGTFDSGRTGARYRRLAVEFSYNRTFSAKNKSMSWTLPMRPDYTLAFRPLGMPVKEALENDLITYVHFDAKYKANDLTEALKQIHAENEGFDGDRTDDAQSRRDVKRVDILKMHAYRDAIRRTGGAYVLYPGTEVKLDRENGEILPGLGAFTLSPSHDSSESIKTFLKGVAFHLCDRITRWENYTYRAYQIYSQSKEAWNASVQRTQDYLVPAVDEEETIKGQRQNIAQNAAARFADPERYYGHLPTEKREEVKWAFMQNLMAVPVEKFKAAKPDPEKIALITVDWHPPANFIVQRYVEQLSGELLYAKYAQRGAPVFFNAGVNKTREYYIWEVRSADPEILARQLHV